MSANPFAVPNAAAIELNRARRERVKITVYTVLGCLVALCLGLLFQGCKHHEAAAENPMKDVENAATTPVPTANTPPLNQTNAPTAEAPATPVQPTKAETLYVIKSGDSLARIAKVHRTSVQAIRSANGLEDNRLVVGKTLRIPSADS